MNYLEKYLPKRKDPSAAAIQRDDEAWQEALNRANGIAARSGVSNSAPEQPRLQSQT